MPVLTTLIVDDELQSRALIRKLLSDHFSDFEVEEADSVAEAFNKIVRSKPSLIFLDVQMRNESGFDLLDQLPRIDSGIIFITAHSEFAVKAFKYSALDYLMKPIDTMEFKNSVERALMKLQQSRSSYQEAIGFLQQVKTNQKFPDKLTVPTSDGFLFIKIPDIVYCHAISNYTEFHLNNNQKIVSSYTLGYYDELLQEHDFFRVHRSYLINLAHVRMYKKTDGGTIVMNNGDEVEISRNNKEAFLKLLKF